MVEPKLTMAHVRALGYCPTGIRRRMKDLGLDFRAFVTSGLPLSDFENIHDADVRRCVASVDSEARHG